MKFHGRIGTAGWSPDIGMRCAGASFGGVNRNSSDIVV